MLRPAPYYARRYDACCLMLYAAFRVTLMLRVATRAVSCLIILFFRHTPYADGATALRQRYCRY